MDVPEPDAVTRLLQRAAGGEPAAADELLPLIYDELRGLAGRYMRNERSDHTLQATALVHEAYARLVDDTRIEWQGRGHFMMVAARAMRNILVDHARGRGRAKRGGGWRQVSMEAAEAMAPSSEEIDLVALDEVLDRLGQLDQRKARLVELRFFAGLTSEDAAEVLGISRTTASEEWRMARAWLYRELKDAAR